MRGVIAVFLQSRHMSHVRRLQSGELPKRPSMTVATGHVCSHSGERRKGMHAGRQARLQSCRQAGTVAVTSQKPSVGGIVERGRCSSRVAGQGGTALLKSDQRPSWPSLAGHSAGSTHPPPISPTNAFHPFRSSQIRATVVVTALRSPYRPSSLQQSQSVMLCLGRNPSIRQPSLESSLDPK